MTVMYWTLGVVLVLIAGVLAWSASLPKEGSATRSVTIDAPIEVVFDLVTDIGNQASWRSDIGRVEMAEIGKTWVEHTSQGIEITFREEAKQADFYAISFSSAQGFTGNWQGRFVENDGKTGLTITETIRTDGLLARAMTRLFAPPGAHIDLYLRDLAKAVDDP